MKHIVLLGDSIFDNAAYVHGGESVSEQLSSSVKDCEITLLAVDGDLASDVNQQLESLPNNASHVFVSCGGNDALPILEILDDKVANINEALSCLVDIRNKFRSDYKKLIAALLKRHSHFTLCTVYNKIPGISENALAALALFNEVILEEAIAHKLSIIDLRNICQEVEDYSSVSFIEPSSQGALKIANVISQVANNSPIDPSVSTVHI